MSIIDMNANGTVTWDEFNEALGSTDDDADADQFMDWSNDDNVITKESLVEWLEQAEQAEQAASKPPAIGLPLPLPLPKGFGGRAGSSSPPCSEKRRFEGSPCVDSVSRRWRRGGLDRSAGTVSD